MPTDPRRVAAVVSIRAPARGATEYAVWPCVTPFRFNSRSREGSDDAPDGGGLMTGSFNSRSREGSDVSRRTDRGRANSFNSRSREGSDKIETVTLPWTEVSIRAPARGATAIIGWQVLSGISQRRALACQQGTGG